MDEVRWLLPVRPGDTLRAVAEVKEATPSRSKPDRGVLKLGVTSLNQRDEVVMTVTLIIMVLRRRA
jgi:acyl dehydratase